MSAGLKEDFLTPLMVMYLCSERPYLVLRCTRDLVFVNIKLSSLPKSLLFSRVDPGVPFEFHFNSLFSYFSGSSGTHFSRQRIDASIG